MKMRNEELCLVSGRKSNKKNKYFSNFTELEKIKQKCNLHTAFICLFSGKRISEFFLFLNSKIVYETAMVSK